MAGKAMASQQHDDVLHTILTLFAPDPHFQANDTDVQCQSGGRWQVAGIHLGWQQEASPGWWFWSMWLEKVYAARGIAWPMQLNIPQHVSQVAGIPLSVIPQALAAAGKARADGPGAPWPPAAQPPRGGPWPQRTPHKAHPSAHGLCGPGHRQRGPHHQAAVRGQRLQKHPGVGLCGTLHASGRGRTWGWLVVHDATCWPASSTSGYRSQKVVRSGVTCLSGEIACQAPFACRTSWARSSAVWPLSTIEHIHGFP